jgi:5-(carboxyamino)imidazole ribonucleotide synthase
MGHFPKETDEAGFVSKVMKPFLPGSTIGLLGGGQLGRMFAIAGRKMGYRIHTFDPTPDCPTGQVADREVNRPFTDEEALRDFAKQVDVITYEFENIPVEPLKAIEGMVPLYPNPQVLHICQNRRREKEWLQGNGFPVAPFRVVDTIEAFKKAVAEIGVPSVLKTADFGYDGKGQQKLSASSDLDQVWKNLQAPVGVLEGWISFEAELSVIVARNIHGEIKTFPVVRNHHENHILALSQVPAEFPPEVEESAIQIAHGVAEKFGLVGLMAVECFLTKEGKILINELAPRTHNSGHFSFDACVTSQFEQQLRAVCGLPLGSTDVMKPVVMRNILGDEWRSAIPAWDRLLALPGLKLHLYGKEEAKPGRKMGHYTVLGNSIEDCLRADREAQKILGHF